jgi:hypothetical protein
VAAWFETRGVAALLTMRVQEGLIATGERLRSSLEESDHAGKYMQPA